MVRRDLSALTFFAFIAASAVAGAQGPLQPSPPGSVVQNVGAYLAGDGMNSRYQVVASRKQVGTADEIQWYLSVYGPPSERGPQPLLYQSPSLSEGDGLVPKLEQGHGTKLYFPRETLKIVGKGELMGEARDQAVAQITAASADCGGATVAVLQADGNRVHVAARVDNPCGLTAKIDHHTIVLSGPYYGKNAALCCPTKPHAVATLRYVDGAWVEKPQYFKLTVPVQTATVTPLTHPTPIFTPIFKSVVTTPAPTGPPPPSVIHP
jgi:hypothetical protein